jgi:hypothetical protein
MQNFSLVIVYYMQTHQESFVDASPAKSSGTITLATLPLSFFLFLHETTLRSFDLPPLQFSLLPCYGSRRFLGLKLLLVAHNVGQISLMKSRGDGCTDLARDFVSVAR